VWVYLVRTVVIGAINWDTNLFIKRFPRSGQEAIVGRVTHVPGGKAGNTAVAAARLLGPKQAAIFGGLGKDSIGADQVKIFESEGVVTSGLKFCDDAESGQAYIAVDEEGANIIYKHSGANALLKPSDLDDPARRTLISEAATVAIMDPPLDTAIRAAETAKEFRKVVAWDPGVNSELGVAKVHTLMKNIDYLVANEHEVANLTGVRSPVAAAKRLSAKDEHLKVVVKLGEKGCFLYARHKKQIMPNLDLTSFGLKAVNTVGCGDAFLGAFVAALSEGLSDVDALRWGNCAGGLKATRLETRGSPERETLLKHLS
jgi:ribokinase